MPSIRISYESVHIELSSAEKIMSVRCSDFNIPIQDIKFPIKKNPLDTRQMFVCRGLRVGTHIPGYYCCGNY